MTTRDPNTPLDEEPISAAGNPVPGKDPSEERTRLLSETPSLRQPEAPSADLEEGAAEGLETEEVFVILPDGEEGAIPVVETEVVDEESPGASPMEDDMPPTQEVVEGIDAAVELAAGDAGTLPADLEQIESDLDDELLETAPAAEGDLHGPELFAASEGPHGPEAVGSRRGGRWRTVVALAATLAVAATGTYFFYVQPRWAGAGSHVAAVARPVHPVSPTGAGVGKAGSPAGKTSAGDPSSPDVTVDPAKLAREAFHGKALLAIELGFVGEVSNE